CTARTSDVDRQSTEIELRACENPLDRERNVVQRDAELGLVVARRNVIVRADGLDLRIDPKPDARTPTHCLRDRRYPVDLLDALDVEREDPALTGANRQPDLVVPLGDAAVEDPLRRNACAERRL